MHGMLPSSKNEQITATHNCSDESTDTVFTEDSRCKGAHVTAICLQFGSVVAGLAGRAGPFGEREAGLTVGRRHPAGSRLCLDPSAV